MMSLQQLFLCYLHRQVLRSGSLCGPNYNNSQWFPTTIKTANLLCQPPINWLVVLQPPLFLTESSITCAQGCVLNVASAPCPFSALARPTDSLGSGVCWVSLIFLSEAAHILTLYPFSLALFFVIHIATQDLCLYSRSYQICTEKHSYQYSTMVMARNDMATSPEFKSQLCCLLDMWPQATCSVTQLSHL